MCDIPTDSTIALFRQQSRQQIVHVIWRSVIDTDYGAQYSYSRFH